MRWFQGGIAEAVATSKARNAVFVVFVNGQDDVSRKAASTVDSVAVSSKLETEDFVAIKLESDSESYRQFVQIYQLVPVPSLFFIGGNGVPLEVIAGDVNEADLVRRIDSVLEKCKGKPKEDDKSSVSVAQEASNNSQNEAAAVTEVPSGSEDKILSDSQPSVPAASAAPGAMAASSASAALIKEEKIERAKELIEKKRKEKQEEEEQKERTKELERRQMGQDVQKLRRWQQDQELKQLKEERQREKAEEAAARERILKQIAQDKAERAVRFNQEKDLSKRVTPEQEPVRQAPFDSSTSNVARIQFRLPDGSTHSRNFEPTTTVGEMRTYAASQLNLPFRDFSMSTSFPRREFTAADDSQTLRDVQLVPTAVILILPASSGSVISSSSHNYTGALSRMVWSLLTPLLSLVTYLRNLVFGGGGGGAAGGTNLGHNDSKKKPSNAKNQNPTGARRRNPGPETSINRQGNVHRLANQRDSSDDENNTWNGNSTQQM